MYSRYPLLILCVYFLLFPFFPFLLNFYFSTDFPFKITCTLSLIPLYFYVFCSIFFPLIFIFYYCYILVLFNYVTLVFGFFIIHQSPFPRPFFLFPAVRTWYLILQRIWYMLILLYMCLFFNYIILPWALLKTILRCGEYVYLSNALKIGGTKHTIYSF